MAVKLLDVTLRDGGYKTNFHFSEETIKYVLTTLDQAGIDYIEIGYRNGSFKPIPNVGPAAMCPRDYIEYCRKCIQSSKLTVIFHPKNIQKEDLIELQDCGVNSVRMCFSAQNPTLSFKLLDIIKQFNFEVFVNITRTSEYTREKLGSWVKELEKYDIEAIYLADSNGSLNPKEISNLLIYLQKKCQTPFGFHAHDNLFLAQANAIAAMAHGVKFIDASLFGFGKGAGNLKTEGFASFLYSEGLQNRYSLCKLLEAAQYVKAKLHDGQPDFIVKDTILGIFNLSQDDAVTLGEFSNIEDYYHRAERYCQAERI